MAIPTPDQVAAKWSQNLAGATSRITSGVQAVTVSPGQKAAAAKSLWVQNTQAAADKFAARAAKVTTADWQQAMTSKGIPRVASGATAAQPKFQAFMTQLLPYVQNQVNSLPPRGTLEQNIARATALMRGMANFKQS